MKAVRCLILLLALLGLAGCATPKADGTEGEKKADAEAQEPVVEDEAKVDVSFLLSMTYEEACTLTPAKATVGFSKVAAESIEVMQADEKGQPVKVRAKGKVFVETDFGTGDVARALAQEALVMADEVILRGRPVVQRGGSTLEGLDDGTVFYLANSQLRAIGMQRLTNVGQLSELPGLPGWEEGPNPLLPPLDTSAVPNSIRDELKKQLDAERARQQTFVPVPEAEKKP
jgi:hypothetical protein